MPGPEPAPAEQETEAQREVRELLALPMVEWTTEQVLTWCWVRLPEWAADVAALDLDGEELATLVMRSVTKFLKSKGAPQPEAAAQALLERRDAIREAQTHPTRDEGKVQDKVAATAS